VLFYLRTSHSTAPDNALQEEHNPTFFQRKTIMSALHSTATTSKTQSGAIDSPRPRVNTRKADFIEEDFFGPQPTSSKSLPDPKVLAENLARCVLEILSGARDLEQIARWVTDDVHRVLLTRVHVAARARALKKIPAHRPSFSIGSTTVCQPADGVAECCVVLHGKARSRSIAIRLEGLDGRWRATAIHVL